MFHKHRRIPSIVANNAQNDPAERIHHDLGGDKALHGDSASSAGVDTTDNAYQKKCHRYPHAARSHTSNRLRTEVECRRLLSTMRVEGAYSLAESPSDGNIQQNRLEDA